MKTKELTPKQILSVRCRTCGAAPGEVCELNTGAPRTGPHWDRKLSAADAVEMKLSKRSTRMRPLVDRVDQQAFGEWELIG